VHYSNPPPGCTFQSQGYLAKIEAPSPDGVLS
jgi:hypothetical protein